MHRSTGIFCFFAEETTAPSATVGGSELTHGVRELGRSELTSRAETEAKLHETEIELHEPEIKLHETRNKITQNQNKVHEPAVKYTETRSE